MTPNLIYRLLRIDQWVKNLFVFIPAFFAGVIFNERIILSLLLGFISFSLASSTIYIINDIRDAEDDRNHPKKKYRPIARKLIAEKTASIFAVIIAIISLGSAIILSPEFLLVILIYLSSQVAYSMGLKRVSNLDVIIVALGFVFRVVAGGIIVEVALSQWLIIMIFLLALFLALAKRLEDVNLLNDGNKVTRKSAKNYNKDYIVSAISMMASIIIVSYIMYTISDDVQNRWDSEYIYITSVFVIAGLMRYLQITLVEHNSGSPDKILYRDKFILVNIICWIASFVIIIYI